MRCHVIVAHLGNIGRWTNRRHRNETINKAKFVLGTKSDFHGFHGPKLLLDSESSSGTSATPRLSIAHEKNFKSSSKKSKRESNEERVLESRLRIEEGNLESVAKGNSDWYHVNLANSLRVWSRNEKRRGNLGEKLLFSLMNEFRT